MKANTETSPNSNPTEVSRTNGAAMTNEDHLHKGTPEATSPKAATSRLAEALSSTTARVASVGIATLLFSAALISAGDGAGGRPGTLVLAMLVTIALLAALSLLSILSGADATLTRDAARLSSEPLQQALLRRWISRARWVRNVGGMAGVFVWLFATNGQGDILIFGIGGIAVGAVAGEMHLARPSQGARSADLTVRSLSRYLGRREVAAGAVAGVACLVATGLALANGLGGRALIGSGGLGALAVVTLIGWRVALRRRPATTDSLRAADDLVRELAINHGLGAPGVSLAFALAGSALASMEPALGDSVAALSFICRVSAIAIWWFNRRLGLGRVERLRAR